MSKSILVIVSGNYIYGAEKVTLDVIRSFKEHGHRVHCLVSGWNDGNFIRRLNELGIKYTVTKLGWYYVSKILWSMDSFIHYPKAIVDFIRLKRNFKPDIIYTISYRQIALLYPFLNKNIVYNVQDPNGHSRLSKFFIRLIDKKIVKYTASSQSIKKDIESIGIDAQKVEVIYNGVDLPLSIAKIPFNRPRIGIIGQLIHRKGHLVLLEAVKIVKEKYKQRFVVYIIGDGDETYKQKLTDYVQQNKLEEYIQFKGFVNSSEDIYGNIDFTVVPSFAEAFGLIAVESYFYKIPVIASKVGGLEEIVLPEKTGYLFTPGDANELADKINLFLDDPRRVKKMGEEGFEYCSARFLKTTMTDKLELLFRNL